MNIEFDDDVCINFNISKTRIYERYIDPILKEHNTRNYHGTVIIFSKHNITAKNIINLPHIESEKDIIADCLYVNSLTAKNVKANDIECFKICACCVDSTAIKAEKAFVNNIKSRDYDIKKIVIPCGD